ncbi:MAG: aryl-sulfate sulfotransferase [Myxococcales bacterium]|nr:aryl-sulfate sulfotransferase [Myxococcales bacterium]
MTGGDVPVRTLLLVTALTLAVPALAGAANFVTSSCTTTKNKLRYDCTFETDTATSVAVEWDDGTTVRSAPRSAIGSTHDFRLVGMRAGVVVNWRAETGGMLVTPGSTVTGSFMTSKLDRHEWAALSLVSTVVGYSVQNVLFPADCGTPVLPGNQMLFIADHAGGVVWYQDPARVTGGGPIVALNFTERGTILAIHGEDIVEYTLEGDLVTHFEKGVDFTNTVHHDVFRRGNHLFALSSVDVLFSDGTEQQYDGVMGFDDSGWVAEWDSSGLYDPYDSTAAIDPSTDCYSLKDCRHTNALWVGRDDSWTMSQRTPGRVIQVDGDPSSATFKEVLWELDGQGVNGDFAIVSSVTTDLTFEGQHNVQFLPNGKLLMFDNEFDPYAGAPTGTGSARGLEIRLVGSNAVITDEYDTGWPGGDCSSRGSAFKIDGPSSNVLTTCADSNTIQEIDSSGITLWEAKTSCGGATIAGQPYRAIPIELP